EVEMLLEQLLVAAGDENEFLDPRVARFFPGVLDEGAVVDRQHLLGQDLGRGQEARAKSRHGEHGLAHGLEAVSACHNKTPVLTLCWKIGGTMPHILCFCKVQAWFPDANPFKNKYISRMN